MLSIYCLVLSQFYFSLFLNAFIQKVRERKGVQQGLTSISILRAKKKILEWMKWSLLPAVILLKRANLATLWSPCGYHYLLYRNYVLSFSPWIIILIKWQEKKRKRKGTKLMPISFLTITQKGVFSNIMDNKISFPENMIYQSNKKSFRINLVLTILFSIFQLS